MTSNIRELAMFNLTLDSKLRARDLTDEVASDGTAAAWVYEAGKHSSLSRHRG